MPFVRKQYPGPFGPFFDPAKITKFELEIMTMHRNDALALGREIRELQRIIRDRLTILTPELRLVFEAWNRRVLGFDSISTGAVKIDRSDPAWGLSYHMELCKLVALQELWEAMQQTCDSSTQEQVSMECDGSGI